MTTQAAVNVRTVRALAAELAVECEVESRDEVIVITLATGEVEECETVEEACETVRAYA